MTEQSLVELIEPPGHLYKALEVIDTMLTVPDMMKRLKLSKNIIKRMRRTQQIPAVKIAGTWRCCLPRSLHRCFSSRGSTTT